MGAVLRAMRKLAQDLCPHVSKSLSTEMGWCSSQHGDRQSMKDPSRLDMRATCRGRGWRHPSPTVPKPHPPPASHSPASCRGLPAPWRPCQTFLEASTAPPNEIFMESFCFLTEQALQFPTSQKVSLGPSLPERSRE